MLLWCDMSTFRKYIALIYPLSKTIKIFEFKKSRFFHQSWKNRFLLKTKSPNKKRSADLKSALNFEFNYVPHYIWLWLGCGVRSILLLKRLLKINLNYDFIPFFELKSNLLIILGIPDLSTCSFKSLPKTYIFFSG